jgi:hypothetical protein
MPRLIIDDEEHLNHRGRRHRSRNRRRRRRHCKRPGIEPADPNLNRVTPEVHDHSSNGHLTRGKHSGLEPQQLLTENDRFIDLENLGSENIAQCFMTKDGNEPMLEGQAEPVASFCSQTALQELFSNNPKLSQKKICLIDDRTRQGATSKALGVCKPLSVHEMFIKLLEKVSGFVKKEVQQILTLITEVFYYRA